MLTGTDDALVVLAWAISVAQTGTAAAWMKASWYGYRSSDVPALSVDQQIFASKMMFVEGLLYNPVLGLVKWSIIVFLMRLDDKRRSIRFILWALLVVNIGHMIAVFFGVVRLAYSIDSSACNSYVVTDKLYLHQKTSQMRE